LKHGCVRCFVGKLGDDLHLSTEAAGWQPTYQIEGDIFANIYSRTMLLPGIRINTAPDDYFPVKQMQMGRFVGDSWHLFGPIFKGDPNGG
jgi:hypothetical protein